MWVKNEYGHLLNLSHTLILRVVSAGGEFFVQSRFGSLEMDYADLTRAKSEAEAQEVLDRVEYAIVRGESYVDLTKPGAGSTTAGPPTAPRHEPKAP